VKQVFLILVVLFLGVVNIVNGQSTYLLPARGATHTYYALVNDPGGVNHVRWYVAKDADGTVHAVHGTDYTFLTSGFNSTTDQIQGTGIYSVKISWGSTLVPETTFFVFFEVDDSVSGCTNRMALPVTISTGYNAVVVDVTGSADPGTVAPSNVSPSSCPGEVINPLWNGVGQTDEGFTELVYRVTRQFSNVDWQFEYELSEESGRQIRVENTTVMGESRALLSVGSNAIETVNVPASENYALIYVKVANQQGAKLSVKLNLLVENNNTKDASNFHDSNSADNSAIHTIDPMPEIIFSWDQDAFSVNSGSSHDYKIERPEEEVIYKWQIFSDSDYTIPALPELVELVPFGSERDNEIHINWNSAGDYYLMVTVTSATGCANRMAWYFAVDEVTELPVARIAGSPFIVTGNCPDAAKLLDASSSTGEGLSFNWSPSAYLDNPSVSKPVFLPGKDTRYLLTVTDVRGQTDTISVMVLVAEAPKVIMDENIFVDASNAVVLLNASQSSGSGLSYSWLSVDGTILNGETNPNAQASGLGTYYLTITDQFGCTAIDSIKVNLYTQAVRDTTNTDINYTVDINVLANDIPLQNIDPSTLRIVSSPRNGIAVVSSDSLISYTPDQYYVGQDEFTYSICDYYRNCDEAPVLVLVNDVPFFIPEAFSPNGDGINDKFEIKGIAKYNSIQIEIFNRWGNIVFQSGNYGEGPGRDGFWDGTAKNGLRIGSGPVPSGTYFYVLKLNGNENVSGSVYLDR
jgi:gliding motility-associated-like protein